MGMRPIARMNDEDKVSPKVERRISAIVDFVFFVGYVSIVLWQANEGNWNWAFLWLGVILLIELSSISSRARELVKIARRETE